MNADRLGGPYLVPALLAVGSIAGLVLALLVEGIADVVGCALLASPLAAAIWVRFTR